MRWIKVLGLIAVVYVLALLVYFPVGHVYAWVQPQVKQAQLYGLHGTPWSGKADVAIIAGLRFKNLHWRIRFLPLLLGRVQLGVSVDVGRQRIHGDVGRSWTGVRYIQSWTGKLAVNKMLEMAKIRIAEAEGHLSLENIGVSLDAENVKSATGKITWQNAKLTVLQTVDLDEIHADISEEKNMLKAMLSSSTDSAIDVDGTFTLKPSGEYSFNGKVAERKKIGLQQILAGRCRRGRDGKCRVKWEARLPFKLM